MLIRIKIRKLSEMVVCTKEMKIFFTGRKKMKVTKMRVMERKTKDKKRVCLNEPILNAEEKDIAPLNSKR